MITLDAPGGRWLCLLGGFLVTPLRFDRPLVPVLHTYFHYEIPKSTARSRRYVAYQLEYAESKIKASRCDEYMRYPVAAWEYTNNQLPFWHSKGITNVTQVCPPGSLPFQPLVALLRRAEPSAVAIALAPPPCGV